MDSEGGNDIAIYANLRRDRSHVTLGYGHPVPYFLHRSVVSMVVCANLWAYSSKMVAKDGSYIGVTSVTY